MEKLKNGFLNKLFMVLAKQIVRHLNKSLATLLAEGNNNFRAYNGPDSRTNFFEQRVAISSN